jgi:putative tryptophan/tyrosine transport system substrate-binding protein
MGRREFITLLGGAAATAPLVARAQGPSGKIARVGIIDDALYRDAFRQQLCELHYVEGQDLTYVYLRTDGSPAQLDAAAMALAQLPVNVIVAFGTPQAQAAQRATKTIPIVAISIGDPIAAGLVTSLAHPGGNITGNTILAPDIVTKRLQILKDAIPTVARVAYLWNPDNPGTADVLEHLRRAAPLFHMTVVSLEARTVVDFDRVFAQMSSDRPDAVLLTNDPAHQAHMPAIIDFLLRNRISGLFQTRENVVAGGLMSYGVSLPFDDGRVDRAQPTVYQIHRLVRRRGRAGATRQWRFRGLVHLSGAQGLFDQHPVATSGRRRRQNRGVHHPD